MRFTVTFSMKNREKQARRIEENAYVVTFSGKNHRKAGTGQNRKNRICNIYNIFS